MTRWTPGMLLAGFLSVVALWGTAWAQYRPPPRQEPRGAEETDRFQESVDLRRFRDGQIEWNTQELIASGLTALHEDHVKILDEIEELKKAIARLEERQ